MARTQRKAATDVTNLWPQADAEGTVNNEKCNYSFSSGTVILKLSEGTSRDISGREKKKGVITMKSTKKLVAAMLTLILLFGIIPSSQAESTC